MVLIMVLIQPSTLAGAHAQAACMQVFSEINKNYPTMPFSTRVLDQRNCRLGLVECLNHGLLHPYPVMHERSGVAIVQLKSTVLLMANGSDK